MARHIARAARLPDLSPCETEPIHSPGAIQPHGVLLALQGPALRITQASANAATLLGRAATELLGCELATALDPALAAAVGAALARHREVPAVPASLRWQAPAGGSALAGYVHEADDLAVLELLPAAAPPTPLGAMLAQALPGFSAIHAQRALAAKLQATVELLRRLTDYDRVMVYRFDLDWHGEVVAEARGSELAPYLGLHFPAADIPAQARRLYLINPTRVMPDVDYTPAPLLPLVNPVTGRPLDLSRSLLRDIAPVHLEYLRNMGVRSSLSTALLCDGQLWGLITCHHGTPRQASAEVHQLADWLGQDLAAQITLASEVDTRRIKAELKQHRDRVFGAVRRGVRLAALIEGPVVADLLGASGAAGVALLRGDAVITGGLTPDPQQIRAIAKGLTATHRAGRSNLLATDCLSTHLPETADLAVCAAGVALLPLNARQSDRLIWFRGEQVRQMTWGGDPDKAVDRSADGRPSPRRSFAAWSQQVRLHSRQWHPEELASVRRLGSLLDIEQRRMAEDAVRANESLLHDVLDSLTAHIAVLDGRGVITLVNAAWRRFAERNGGGVNCQPGTDYLEVCRGALAGRDGVEAAASLHGIQQVLERTRGSFRLTYPCDSPTEVRWFELVVLPLRGARAGVVIAHEEITAYKAAEQALRASEERLQLVLAGANDGFWDWNLATGDLALSPRWAQMLGYDERAIEPSVRGWERLVHPADLPHAQAELRVHLAGATPYYQNEHRLLAKDGDWRWVLARAKVTARDVQGRPLRMAGTTTDITERRRLDEALRASLAEVQRHNTQMIALSRMNDLLLYCETRDEAYAVIAQGAAILFAPHAGALAVSEGAVTELHRVAAWGPSERLASRFMLRDCWALRRGHPYEVDPGRTAIDCRHFPGEPPPTYLCVPLNVRGATLGLLHVSTAATLAAGQFQDLRTLTLTVAESIKLALSNLRLREDLRDCRD